MGGQLEKPVVNVNSFIGKERMDRRKVFETAVRVFYEMQDRITRALEEIELSSSSARRASLFREDLWDHSQTSSTVLTGGGGRSRAIENGRVFEKGGVNVSDVSGRFSEEMSRSQPGESRRFRAAGISLVLHPANPHAPAVHANFRVIKRITEQGEIDRMWFGGGADLTPHLFYEEDARHFHRMWHDLCQRHREIADYEQMKQDCDAYFFLPHRGEARGIGGIFYDYREGNDERWLHFMKDACQTFLESYLPILKRRMDLPYTEAEREFQLYRRGRYVEFNLIHDRGTLFGLRTGGRIESILMSLPSPVYWKYNYDPENDPLLPEALRRQISDLYSVLRRPRSWTD
jgi:coproporphyrinogen III oxidase